jgi:hypothetical protein
VCFACDTLTTPGIAKLRVDVYQFCPGFSFSLVLPPVGVVTEDDDGSIDAASSRNERASGHLPRCHIIDHHL